MFIICLPFGYNSTHVAYHTLAKEEEKENGEPAM